MPRISLWRGVLLGAPLFWPRSGDQPVATTARGRRTAAQPEAQAKPEKTGQDPDPKAKPKAKALAPRAKGQRPARPPGFYMGRQIADVMSWEGVDWLFRETRVEEEQPETMLDALKIPQGATVADVGAGAAITASAWQNGSGPRDGARQRRPARNAARCFRATPAPPA